MAATVHAGALARRFEQLCRLAHPRLRDVAVAHGQGYRVASEAVPSEGGLYTFWWTGDLEKLKERQRVFDLHGPGGQPVSIEYDDEWLGIEAGGPVPLYVGKTGSLRKRMTQHLLASRPKRVLEGSKLKAMAPTTSCQLRAGVERLFPNEQKPLELLLDNIGVSFVELDGDEHAVNRFYLEDFAIGCMRPILNVDVER